MASMPFCGIDEALVAAEISAMHRHQAWATPAPAPLLKAAASKTARS